jgi:hypothetical protein
MQQMISEPAFGGLPRTTISAKMGKAKSEDENENRVGTPDRAPDLPFCR